MNCCILSTWHVGERRSSVQQSGSERDVGREESRGADPQGSESAAAKRLHPLVFSFSGIDPTLQPLVRHRLVSKALHCSLWTPEGAAPDGPVWCVAPSSPKRTMTILPGGGLTFKALCQPEASTCGKWPTHFLGEGQKAVLTCGASLNHRWPRSVLVIMVTGFSQDPVGMGWPAEGWMESQWAWPPAVETTPFEVMLEFKPLVHHL